ncbi:MAG: S-layer homology domain-containing protein [Thermoguttaceae bacterium]|nr:S-layer homology domain-containing protein [Thermoguttaceae bacterium]
MGKMKQKKTTRRFFRSAALLGVALAVAPTFAESPTPENAAPKAPVWILNNGPDGAEANVGGADLRFETGLTTMNVVGTDATFSLPIGENDRFAAAERPFFAFRYKIESDQKVGGLFFTTDELTSLSDASFSQFPVVCDGVWRDLVVDMRSYPHQNWKGVVSSFRLDATNPSSPGSTISLSRLGFFPSEEAARAFLAEANDAPDYSLPATLTAPLQKCEIPGGTLGDGWRRGDYLLQNAEEAPELIAAGARPETLVVVRVGKENAGAALLSSTTRLGFTTFQATAPGAYRLAVSEEAASLADVAGRSDERAIRFAVARGFLGADEKNAFRPDAPTTDAEKTALCERLASFGVDASDLKAALETASTRAQAAVCVAEAVERALDVLINSPFDAAYFGRERLRIGAWGNFRPADFNDEYMRTYADCGFDFLIAMPGVPTKTLLQTSARHGVEVYVNDGGFENPDTATAEYCDWPNYAGHYIVDEPGSDDYDKLAALSKRYIDATGKVPYINLLPMYANDAQLKYGAGAAAIEYYDVDPNVYRRYCDDFCRKFDVDYICTDIYPLNWVGDKKVTYQDYVESINAIATVAREREKEFWCYIQTFAWTDGKRTPTEAEFRWQCYSMLSFGCKCVLCWTYAGYNPEFPSLVDIASRKSTAWYEARPVFQELRRLSDEYVKYRNVGAFTHNCTDATPYLKMKNEYKNFETIREIRCEEPLLIGCFERKDGDGTAFTLVNMADWEANRGATVRLKIDGTATAWTRGVPETVEPDADGFANFYLAPGEGVFVTVAP